MRLLRDVDVDVDPNTLKPRAARRASELYWFGTNIAGRDIYSRGLLWRASIADGRLPVAIHCLGFDGLAIGLVSGMGGWADRLHHAGEDGADVDPAASCLAVADGAHASGQHRNVGWRSHAETHECRAAGAAWCCPYAKQTLCGCGGGRRTRARDILRPIAQHARAMTGRRPTSAQAR